MTAPAPATREPTITSRLDDQPTLVPGQIRETTRRELGIRFLAGCLTSVAAGVLTLVAGPRVGGIMLAFPAILAASLTLIEEQEDSEEAREDARGASAGAIGLIGFAVTAWLLLGRLPGGLVLLCAGAAWLIIAGLLYLLLWWRPRRPPKPR